MQVLLAVYFFLAGLLVHRHPYLWLIPLVSTAFAMLHAATHTISTVALPFYALLPGHQQAWWCADVAHLLYSATASMAAAAYIYMEPSALQVRTWFCALHSTIANKVPSMITTTNAVLLILAPGTPGYLLDARHASIPMITQLGLHLSCM